MAGEKCIMLDSDYVDACNAVREKGGSTSPAIKSGELAQAIRDIPTGGPAPVIQPLEVTENGEYTAPPGVDGYSPVSVNVPSGGGEDHTSEDNLLQRIGDSYTNDRIKTLDWSVFQSWQNLKSISLPAVERVNAPRAFAFCKNLTNIDMPLVTYTGGNAFQECKSIKSLVLPHWAFAGENMNCTELQKVDFGGSVNQTDRPQVNRFGFNKCTALKTVIIRNVYYILINVDAFYETPIASGTGYIYVPRALIERYHNETNWVTYASQFRAIEDYPEITGG